MAARTNAINFARRCTMCISSLRKINSTSKRLLARVIDQRPDVWSNMAHEATLSARSDKERRFEINSHFGRRSYQEGQDSHDVLGLIGILQRRTSMY